MESKTMLNQFIQICIQIRNAGAVAIGCLMDELIDVVNGFFGHKPRHTHGLDDLGSRLYRSIRGLGWLLGYREQLLRLWSINAPLASYKGLQG